MDFISSSSKGQGNHGLRRRGTSSPPHSEVQLESFCFNRRACSLLWGCSCTHIPLGKENKHQENKAALQSQPRLLSSALYSRAGTVLTHSRSSCTLPLGWALTVLSSLTNLLTPPGLALLFASYSEMSIKKKKKIPLSLTTFQSNGGMWLIWTQTSTHKHLCQQIYSSLKQAPCRPRSPVNFSGKKIKIKNTNFEIHKGSRRKPGSKELQMKASCPSAQSYYSTPQPQALHTEPAHLLSPPFWISVMTKPSPKKPSLYSIWRLSQNATTGHKEGTKGS